MKEDTRVPLWERGSSSYRVLTVMWVKAFFLIFITLFGVKRGLRMILSHRAPSSLNMSSYQTIWTHFRQNFIIFARNI